METLHFDITINAPVATVWETMLSAEAYRVWSEAFSADSSFEGSWDEGSEIRFLGSDDQGALGGLIATISENVENERVSMTFTGQIVDGSDDTDSTLARAISGSTETYRFREDGEHTTLTVETEVFDDEKTELGEGWKRALRRLKELAEEYHAAEQSAVGYSAVELPDGVHSGKHAL
jgi:uncharacterized protein YndB with AHSA1/START domain